MASELNIPFALYQSANIEPDVVSGTVRADTTIWIGYKNTVVIGDKINLHCRQCDISEVYVNKIRCEFSLNDGLRALLTNKKQTYLGEELDLNYRAALEIARFGELEITVPDIYCEQARTELPAPLPRPCPKDVVDRYDKLVRMHKSLTHDMARRSYGPDCSPLGMVDPVSSSPTGRNGGRQTNLLQVRIVYTLTPTVPSSSGAPPSLCGMVFRRPPPLAALFQATLGAGSRAPPPEATATSSKSVPKATVTPAPAVSVYTTSYSSGSLRDVDGVRCWLPCLDALDQRAIYDITLTAPRHWRVSCCGKKLSTFLIAESSSTDTQSSLVGQRKISRFFTPNRIAAMSVGFYMGAVELYKMPLYKVRARVWVATGLNDFVSAVRQKKSKSSGARKSAVEEQGHGQDEEEEEESADSDGGDTTGDGASSETEEEEIKEEPSVQLRPLDSSYYAEFKRRLPSKPTSAAAASSGLEDETDMPPPSKKMRAATGEAVPTAPFSVFLPTSKSEFPKGSKKDTSMPPVSRLYENKVRHSTLGLDISLRLLHKFVGHRYDYEEFTFVYVHDLGCDFVSFDGFALIDAKYLHGELEVYMETTAHLLLLQAYLYAWLKSALPVSAYDAEFIVHGAVGYLLNFYAEEVYGEEDGRYRYQKMYDTVVALEKQGAGFPLASMFPERYDVFGPQFGTYLKCKSAVLFQLIENRVGGKEHMRISLKQLVRSPPVFNPAVRPYKGASKDVLTNFQSLFEVGGRGGNMSPIVGNQTPPTPSQVSHALVQNEERARYRSYSDDGYGNGSMSPYSPYSPTGNRSPSTLGGNMSPATIHSGNVSPYPYNHSGNISPYPYGGGNVSPYPYGGGNVSPYPTVGNKSPYAPYASYHPTLGAATPMYDPYGVRGSAVASAPYLQQTYSPNRYDITNSPAAPAAAESDAISPHLLAPVPTTHMETTVNPASEQEPAPIAGTGTTPTSTDPVTSTTTVADLAAKVTVPIVDSGPGFYAAMAQHEQRIRSNSATSVGDGPVSERAATTTTGVKPTDAALGGPVPQPPPPPSSSSAAAAKAKGPPVLVRQESFGSATMDDRDWAALGCDCVSAESFILTVRHASGASADIDDGFLEKYVYKSGALFLRLHVNMSDKVENKPRQIFVTSQMVGCKEGGGIDDSAEKIDLKVRVAEARDDVVTEPTISFGTKEDQYQQQAYTRPGRRGGKRRGPGRKAEEAELDAQQLEVIARHNREKEARKSALMKVRDMDYPLRYVLLDPMCQQVVETYNASADVLLVEQLYTDYYENNVYFQCQALRSLARAGSSKALITTELSPEAAAFVSGAPVGGDQLNTAFGLGAALNSSFGGSGTSSVVKVPEKSPNMQLKALSDCLLGVPTNINDAKLIASHQFCIYVRGEAAIGLARWQNERAPRTTAPEVVGGNSSWAALDILVDQLHNMFADQDSLEPLPSDFSNESATHLRNTMLLSLASIKAKSGHSPPDVYQTIFKFAKHNEECDLTGGTAENAGVVVQYDDSHYRAVLFLALSRLRFESVSNVDRSVHLTQRIVTMATSAINVAFTRARATARINFTRGDANFLPSLGGRGIDVAAAITCLAELDVQAAGLYAKGRAQPIYPASPTHSLKDVERKQPTGRGPLSGFNYLKYFIPSDVNLMCIHASANRQRKAGKSQITFHLCTPTVRAAAFEGFVRLCFAMQCAHEERLKSFSAVATVATSAEATSGQNHAVANAKAASNTGYIPAAIEALAAVLKSETNLWVKQQAAFVFADVLMDRPARIATQAISLNNYWNCFEWSDPGALTLPQHLDPSAAGNANLSFTLGAGGLGASAVTSSNRRCMQHGGDPTYSQVALKLVWKLIFSSINYDQNVRQSLLTAWKYSFENKIPTVLQSSSSAPDGRILDRFFGNMLPADRLQVCNPTEVTQKIEQRLTKSTSRVVSSSTAQRASLSSSVSARDLSSSSSSSHRALHNQTHSQSQSSLLHSQQSQPHLSSMTSQPRTDSAAVHSNQGSSSSSSSSSASSSSFAVHAASVSTGGAAGDPPLRLSLSLNRSKSGLLSPTGGVEGGEDNTHSGAAGYTNRPVAGKAAPGEKRPTFKFTM